MLSKHTTKRQLVIALLLGSLFRLVALGIVDYKASGHDEREYDRMAWNLVQNKTVSNDTDPPYTPNLSRAPLQSLALALVYAVFGHAVLVARIGQIFLSLATAFIFYLALREWDPYFALIVLWAAMLSPFEAVFAPRLMAETLTEFLIVLAFSLPWWLRNKWYTWPMAGVAFGLLTLARDVYALLAMVVFVIIVSPFRPTVIRAKWGHAMLVVLAMLVTLAPWTYRNYQVTGRFVPVSEGLLWENLWVGSWEDLHHRWAGNPYDSPQPPYTNDAEKQLVETTFHKGRDAAMKQLFLARFRAQPLRVFSRWLERVPLLWIGTRCPFWFKPAPLAVGTRGSTAIKASMFFLNAGVLCAGLLGLIVAARQRSDLLWFAIPVLYTAAIYVPFHNTETRYSEPVYLFVMMFAIWGLLWLKRRRAGTETALAQSI